MKKTKTLAKRIMSVALATMIVLSFALISTSAVPANYVVSNGKSLAVDFENQNIAGFTNGNAFTVAISDGVSDPAHSGNYSLKLTASNSYGKLKIEPKNILGSDFGFEANAQYYVSFWCYSPVSNGISLGTNVGCPPYGGTVTSGSTGGRADAELNQWHKIWFNIDTTGTGTQTYFQPCFNYTTAGSVLYIDDVEIAKYDSVTELTNTVPEGATAVQTALAYGENVLLSADQLVNGTNSGDTVAKTAEYAHWSEMSYEFVANSATSITGLYVSLNNSKFFGSGATLKANTPYYISYYLYCPTKTVGTQFNYFSGGNIINQTIPQGVWTKVSALFTPDEATATATNSHLLKLLITGTTGTDGVNQPVYLDDFVIAELSEEPAAAMFTAGDAEYGVAASTAKLAINSTTELKTTGTVTVEGATVDSAVLSEDKMSIDLSLSGLTAGTDYTATIENAKDVYGRTIEVATVSFTTLTADKCPMEFASTSISDGYAAVYAPVDAIYFTVPYALDEATVIAENFAIEGYNAAITNVELLSAKEVKVSVSGIYPKESYKLSVDNVANTSGGILKDTLSFETTTAGGQYYLNFADGKIPSSQLQTDANRSNGLELVEDFGHNDSKSIMLKGFNDGTYNYAKMTIGGMGYSKTYLVSFWYYSDTWSGDTSNTQWVTLGEWTFSSKTKGQWNKITVPVTTPSNIGGMNMSFWGLGEGQVVYIDDIKVVELYTDIGSPVIKSGDSYRANSVGAGTTTFTIPVSGDATAIKGFAAQYDENGKMLRAGIGTSTENAINITIENGEEVGTKVFLWDATSNAPVSNGFKYNY